MKTAFAQDVELNITEETSLVKYCCMTTDQYTYRSDEIAAVVLQ
jgi:hypothetical protein